MDFFFWLLRGCWGEEKEGTEETKRLVGGWLGGTGIEMGGGGVEKQVAEWTKEVVLMGGGGGSRKR